MRTLSIAACLLLLLLTGLTTTAQDTKPAPKETWRTLTLGGLYVDDHKVKDAKDTYRFKTTELIEQLAKGSDVVLVYRRLDVANYDLTVTGKKKLLATPVFQLLQTSLDDRYYFVGNADGSQLTLHRASVAVANAPSIPLANLGKYTANEWVRVLVDISAYDHSALTDVIRLQRMGKSGKATEVIDGEVLQVAGMVSEVQKYLDVVERCPLKRAKKQAVTWSRSTPVNQSELAASLNTLIQVYARNMGWGDSRFYVKWNGEAELLTGLIPSEFAAFLDDCVDASIHAADRRAEARENRKQSFMTFRLTLPKDQDGPSMLAALEKLMSIEINLGDARFSLLGEQGVIAVRCRKWLEQDVRDSAQVVFGTE